MNKPPQPEYSAEGTSQRLGTGCSCISRSYCEPDASAPEDVVQIETVLPVHEMFALNRTGVVDGVQSDYLRDLGAIVNADLDQGNRTVMAGAPKDGLGTTRSALTLDNEGHIYLAWSLWGYRMNSIVGDWCHHGSRASYQAYATNGASCWVIDWASYDPEDCRIYLHMGIAGGLTDVCNWYVYTNP